MLNIIRVTFVIIGTIIGAGFASGQEILTFFNNYGKFGLIGINLSSIILVVIIYKVLKISLKYNINTYLEFIEIIIPQKLKKNKILVFTIKNIINVFLFISFNIMVSGFSTFFLQEFKICKIVGSIIIAISLFIVLSKGINGVIKINTYLIPILLILVLFLGVKKINSLKIIETNSNINWIISSILYASYNSISLIPILISASKNINTHQKCKYVCNFTYIILFTISVILFFILNTFLHEIKNIEIPIIYIANSVGTFAKSIYGICILIAIFTTAISSGYGFLINITLNKKKYLILLGIICSVSILIGQISFSSLISNIYPVFGYLGIIQIFFLLIA